MKHARLIGSVAMSVMLGLSGCAGRAPVPVQTVQLKDATMDCTAINAEITADAAQKVKLDKESGEKATSNVVAGVGGAILFWPALFLMDFQDAAGKESKALETRDQYLSTLAAQRCPPVPVVVQMMCR